MPFGQLQEMGRPVTIKDEGVSLTSNVASIDFTGAGVTGSAVGNAVTEDITGGAGTGDVVGPASSTDNAVARFDSTTGKLLQNSTVTIGDTGAIATTIANTSNVVGLTVTQNDTTNNPRGISLVNTGTANAFLLDQNGNTSTSVSVGGAFLLENTGNSGAGLVIYSNHATATGRLLAVTADNTGFATQAAYFQQDGTSHCVSIVHNSTGSSAHGLSIASTNPNDTALGVSGQETGKGTMKLTHTYTGTADTNASALSLLLAGTSGGTAAQGIFLDTDSGKPTTGKLLNLRNDGVEKFVVTSAGVGTFAGGITSGVASGLTGELNLKGTTSGTVTIKVADAAGTYTLTLPTTDGDADQFLKTDGSGVLTWSTPAGSGDVTKVGTPVDNQIGVWTGDGTIEGDTALTFNTASNILAVTGSVGVNISAPVSSFHVSIEGAVPATNTFLGTETFLGSSNTTNNFRLINAGDTAAVAANIVLFRARTTVDAPTIVQSGDSLGGLVAQGWDGVTRRSAATILFEVDGTPGSGDMPGRMVFQTTADGAATVTSRLILDSAGVFKPAANDGVVLGTTALGFADLHGATGFTLNIANGDAVITHSAGIFTVSTGDLRVTTAGTNAASVVTVGGTQTLTSKTLTSPTLTTPSAFTTGGTITLAENTSIALDPAGSADGKYTGITVTGTAGATLAFGDLVYLDPTDSRWELTDANAASGADGDARGTIGICVLAAASDGDPTVILKKGRIRADAAFPAMTINAPMFVSETAGDITGTRPSTTDVVIRVVGHAVTSDELDFDPSSDFMTPL